MTQADPARPKADGSKVDTAATTRLLDRGAIALSALCLVHCLALPAALAAAPALAAALPEQPWVHPAILATAAPLAAIALWRGWRRHGQRLPGLLGAIGVALLAAGVVAGNGLTEGGTAETVLTVLGGLTLAAAHLRNWRGSHAGHGH